MSSLGPREELINDLNNDNPVVGLKGPTDLRERFKYRLGRLIGRPISASPTERSSLDVRIGPASVSSSTSPPTDDKRIREFADGLQKLLREIARGSRKDEASNDLWDAILLYVSPGIHTVIMALKQAFTDHRKRFEAMVTQYLGLDDVNEHGSSLDRELGNSIIRLEQSIGSYSSTIKQQNELIEFSWDLLQRHDALDVRLRYLLGSAFAERLYELTCRISHPLSTFHTMIRTASQYSVIREVTFHIGVRTPLPEARGSSPRHMRMSHPRQQSSPLRTPILPCHKVLSTNSDMVDTIRPYLPQEDHGLSVVQLAPASKQVAATLIGLIRHKIPVHPQLETYYAFGFAACRNSREVKVLAKAYQDTLDNSHDPPSVLESLVNALEYNTVPQFISNRTPHNLHISLPAVDNFFRVPPSRRFSVYRLVQFIRDEGNDEPLPCLKRDYGFKLCKQREEVAGLKQLYASVIEKVGVGQLHYACVHGRLREFGVATLGTVEEKMKRLLQNEYPSSSVGFDTLEGCGGFSGRLFKRSTEG